MPSPLTFPPLSRLAPLRPRFRADSPDAASPGDVAPLRRQVLKADELYFPLKHPVEELLQAAKTLNTLLETKPVHLMTLSPEVVGSGHPVQFLLGNGHTYRFQVVRRYQDIEEGDAKLLVSETFVFARISRFSDTKLLPEPLKRFCEKLLDGWMKSREDRYGFTLQVYHADAEPQVNLRAVSHRATFSCGSDPEDGDNVDFNTHRDTPRNHEAHGSGSLRECGLAQHRQSTA